MRKAINDNPVAQLVLIGVLLVSFALLMMMRVMGGKKEETAAAPPVSSSTAVVGSSASTGTSPAPLSSQPSSGSTGTVAPAGSVSPSALVPGPGLPRELISAWKGGDAVVLLIVRGGGIDDRLVRRSVATLSSDPEVTVFVTRAKNIARYSRITQGVGVSRVPALIVVRPRSVSGPVPQAQVSYGFRDAKSVVQTVRDAVYSGRDDIPYYPR